jgi:hypothetical protein
MVSSMVWSMVCMCVMDDGMGMCINVKYGVWCVLWWDPSPGYYKK